MKMASFHDADTERDGNHRQAIKIITWKTVINEMIKIRITSIFSCKDL